MKNYKEIVATEAIAFFAKEGKSVEEEEHIAKFLYELNDTLALDISFEVADGVLSLTGEMQAQDYSIQATTYVISLGKSIIVAPVSHSFYDMEGLIRELTAIAEEARTIRERINGALKIS